MFEIPWNYILVGDKLTNTYLDEQLSKIKNKNVSEFNDWYDFSNKENKKDEIILSCQRENLKWDKKLNFFTLTTIVLLFLILLILVKTYFGTFLISIIIMAPFIIQLISYFFNVYDLYNAEKILNVRIDKIKNIKYSCKDLREIQDYIFVNIRCNNTMVPNIIYDIYNFFYKHYNFFR